VREVDDLLAGDAREEVLVATGEADHLVREDRADHQADVMVDHGPVQRHAYRQLQPPLGQLGDPVRADVAEGHERLGLPPLVVEHSESGVRTAQVGVQLRLGHLGVRAERHQHSDAGGPAMEGLVHRGEQQWQRAAAGGVGNDEADAAADEVRAGQRSDDEFAHLRVVEDLVGTADAVRAQQRFGHTCTFRRHHWVSKDRTQYAATNCCWRLTGRRWSHGVRDCIPDPHRPGRQRFPGRAGPRVGRAMMPPPAEVVVGVGRNGAFILATWPGALHVRLDAAVQQRVERAARSGGITPDRAAKRQRREDALRADMSIRLYGWDPREPTRYDLVLNTGTLGLDACVDIIVHARRVKTAPTAPTV
jgi:hypothetical protein